MSQGASVTPSATSAVKQLCSGVFSFITFNINAGIFTVPSSLSVNLPICGKSANFSIQTTPVVRSLAIAMLSCLMNLGLSFCLFPVFLSTNAIKCYKYIQKKKKLKINDELFQNYR